MDKKRIAIVLFTVGIASCNPCFAETIILKSGQQIKGKILEKTDKHIKIDFSGVPLTYYIEDIQSISEQEQNLFHSDFKKEDNGQINQVSIVSPSQYVDVSVGKEIISNLGSSNFKELEKYFYDLKKSNLKSYEGLSLLSQAYSVFYSMDSKLLNFLDSWCNKYPNSPFPFIARGKFYMGYAWRARGSGLAYNVSAKAEVLFHERIKKAEADFRKAYELDSTGAEVSTNLIKIAMAENWDRVKMEEQFQRAIKADPSYYQAYLAKLNYLMPKWHGSYEEMFSFARQAAAAAPKSTFIPMLLAVAYVERFTQLEDKKYFTNIEIWNEMERTFKNLTAEFPDSNIVHAMYGIIASYAEKLDLAKREFNLLKNFDQIIVTDFVGSFSLLHGFTEAYSKLNRIDELIENCKSFLSRNPEWHKIYMRLGIIYADRKNDYVKAEENFLQYHKLEPDDVEAYVKLGKISAYLKKYKEAVSFLTKAIDLNPSYYDAYYELAEIYYKSLYDLDLAIENYKKAIEINPYNNGYPYNGLARCYSKKSMFIEEEMILRLGLKVAPSYANLHFNLAIVLEKRKDYKSAIDEYKLAIQYNPSNAMAYNNLGQTYADIENYSEAIYAFKTAISLDPNGEAGRFARETLEWIENNRLVGGAVRK